MSNIIWLKPNKPNTKYHAFHVSSSIISETKMYEIVSLCNYHGEIYLYEKDYQIFREKYLSVKAMGINEHDLTQKFSKHCCQKCLISYNHRLKSK